MNKYDYIELTLIITNIIMRRNKPKMAYSRDAFTRELLERLERLERDWKETGELERRYGSI